jgi:hypothetical protein
MVALLCLVLAAAAAAAVHLEQMAMFLIVLGAVRVLRPQLLVQAYSEQVAVVAPKE